jgi:hypothetical protein
VPVERLDTRERVLPEIEKRQVAIGRRQVLALRLAMATISSPYSFADDVLGIIGKDGDLMRDVAAGESHTRIVRGRLAGTRLLKSVILCIGDVARVSR